TIARTTRSTHLPYTTLFRSLANEAIHTLKSADQAAKDRLRRDIEKSPSRYAPPAFYALAIDLHRAAATKDAVFWLSAGRQRARRSEEHTSERHSLRQRVCRL